MCSLTICKGKESGERVLLAKALINGVTGREEATFPVGTEAGIAGGLTQTHAPGQTLLRVPLTNRKKASRHLFTNEQQRVRGRSESFYSSTCMFAVFKWRRRVGNLCREGKSRIEKVEALYTAVEISFSGLYSYLKGDAYAAKW